MTGLEVVTFGCRLNAIESEEARAAGAEAGLRDAVIVNTCAVTAEAVRQGRQAIRRARRERPDARIFVTGCAAQIDPAAFAAMPEIDALIDNAAKGQPGAYAALADVPRSEPAPQPIAGPRTRGFVAVQNGCDHRCTFCVIPYGRGPSRSVPAGAVVERVRALAAEGCAEVVLTGVDVTSWGDDLPGRPRLGQLVARILRLVPDLPRLRLSSLDAAEIDDALLRCFAEEPRLMPHLHLSLQHGDDLILKRMKRRHARADALRLVERVRRVRPDMAFGADLIAGFPTESEAAFEGSLSLVDACDLAYVHVFPFSPRPGTPAARMPQLDGALVKARAARLRAKAAEALGRHLDRQIGRTVQAVVERGGLAHAPDFTEMALTGGQAGQLETVRLIAHDGRRASAAPV